MFVFFYQRRLTEFDETKWREVIIFSVSDNTFLQMMHKNIPNVDLSARIVGWPFDRTFEKNLFPLQLIRKLGRALRAQIKHTFDVWKATPSKRSQEVLKDNPFGEACKELSPLLLCCVSVFNARKSLNKLSPSDVTSRRGVSNSFSLILNDCLRWHIKKKINL